MPTYLYETVPQPDAATLRFEVRQSFDDPPLREHPVTRVPVRRVISGGLATLTGGKASDALEPQGGGCGPESCGCGRFS
jgi:hypothetical protein